MSDWPDPTYFGFNGPPDPDTQLGYLRAAAGWLDSAETARSTDTPEADRAMWGAARLAELNIAMARACADHRIYEYQRKVSLTAQADGRQLFGGTELEDTERAVREQIKAENADYVAAMEKSLGEQLKADDEAFQAVTLRPGADPEPEAEGELWTTGDGWFYYAVDTIPPMLPGMVEKPRWLLARHYAQVLRWSSEQGMRPMPDTWSEVGESLTDGDVCQTLRRPTAEERAAFYGPEPDPQPAIEETHERTTTIPPIRLDEFTNQQGTSLAYLADKELESLINSVTDECARRQRDNGTPWRSPGGAGQWSG